MYTAMSLCLGAVHPNLKATRRRNLLHFDKPALETQELKMNHIIKIIIKENIIM